MKDIRKENVGERKEYIGKRKDGGKKSVVVKEKMFGRMLGRVWEQRERWTSIV